jgi:hypothetical protein
MNPQASQNAIRRSPRGKFVASEGSSSRRQLFVGTWPSSKKAVSATAPHAGQG